MISVEWYDNQKCENCGENKPHCAEITIEAHDDVDPLDFNKGMSMKFCSDCIHELKQKLS